MKPKKEFKNKELETFWLNFQEQAEKEIFAVFDQNLKEITKLITAYKNRYEKLSVAIKAEPENINHLREFNIGLLELLDKYQNALLGFDYDNIFTHYLSTLENESSRLPQSLRKSEIFAGYQLSIHDKLLSLIKKSRINLELFISVGLKKIGNIYRKIRKKPLQKVETFRHRKIPFRRMVRDFAGTQLINDLSSKLNQTIKGKNSVLLRLWKFDEAFDLQLQLCFSENSGRGIVNLVDIDALNKTIDVLKEEISGLQNKVKEWVSAALAESIYKLDAAMQIIDTPDLPYMRFHASRLLENKQVVLKSLGSGIKNWNNTQITLFDDWAVDVEIVLLYYSVLNYYDELKLKIDTFINTQLTINFDQLENFIKASGERISKNNTTARKMEAALKSERQLISSELIDTLLSKIIEKLSGSYTDDIELFRNKAADLFAKISDRRGFIKSTSYERSVKDSEINYISPRDLLSFEAIPHFESALEKIKNLVIDSMEKVRIKLMAMGTVCDFSLESAGIFLEQNRKEIKGTEKVALEGYERALTYVHEAVQLMDNIRKVPLDNLETAIHEFNAEIQSLKNTENIFELNLRLARIRAYERSKKARQDAVKWVQGIIPQIFSYLTTRFHQFNEVVDVIKLKMEMSVEKKQISFEVSEFIRQTELALKKLPFVYQRLYQLQPTDEERFFVNRKKEISLLEMAFDDWLRERFVIVAVLGEKGSGLTSFLSYYKRNNINDFPVIHKSADQKVYEPDQYFKFFAEILDVEKFTSNDEIIEHIQGFGERKVFILENLHYFFLKKVHGMICQKMLFELMSNTVNKIFWIGTYTINSWDYLDKTIQISDYFVREIRLEKMNSENLREIIFKRNKLSGYKVRFETPEELLQSRSFSKLDDNAKQEYLDSHYFDNLTSISNGNVSLAQLYWLRSTRNVTEDTISVGSGFDIDLSFVKEIKSEYLFALYTILIHDGLTLKDYAKLFNLPESVCRNLLIPMLEKGLLIRPKEKFNINPIIFRHIVSFLRSKNFF